VIKQYSNFVLDESDLIFDLSNGGVTAYQGELERWKVALVDFRDTTPFTRLGSARAGNVIGGLDWSRDRLLSGLVRSW
jgi:hypothetical protein